MKIITNDDMKIMNMLCRDLLSFISEIGKSQSLEIKNINSLSYASYLCKRNIMCLCRERFVRTANVQSDGREDKLLLFIRYIIYIKFSFQMRWILLM